MRILRKYELTTCFCPLKTIKISFQPIFAPRSEVVDFNNSHLWYMLRVILYKHFQCCVYVHSSQHSYHSWSRRVERIVLNTWEGSWRFFILLTPLWDFFFIEKYRTYYNIIVLVYKRHWQWTCLPANKRVRISVILIPSDWRLIASSDNRHTHIHSLVKLLRFNWELTPSGDVLGRTRCDRATYSYRQTYE